MMRPNRRRFLVTALAAAGGIFLACGRGAGRAGRRAVARIRIPVKKFDRRKLHEPHDLAG
jgi:hypothetical protein